MDGYDHIISSLSRENCFLELSIAELQGDQQEVEDGLRTLLHNHSEIRAIQILNSSCSEIAFRMILASPHMTSLSLRHCRLAMPAEGGNGIVEADDLVGETLENEGILSRLPVLAPLQSLDLSYCTKYSIRLNMIASRINTSHLKILNLRYPIVKKQCYTGSKSPADADLAAGVTDTRM